MKTKKKLPLVVDCICLMTNGFVICRLIAYPTFPIVDTIVGLMCAYATGISIINLVPSSNESNNSPL